MTYPIIQAPMAGISTPALAAAVSNAGGLGSLGIGASSLEHAHAMIRQTQQLTTQPFNVNVFCHQPAQRDAYSESRWIAYMTPLFAELGAQPPATLAEPYPSFLANEPLFALMCQLRPAVVSFHFGIPPRDWIDRFNALGIYTMATATNLDEAQLIAHAGIKSVIAQGIEAGGHRGMFDPTLPDACQSTLDLVKQLAQHLSIPIVAAGGLMNGHDIQRAQAYGATAAQLGTAFLLCPEAGTSVAHRAHLRTTHATALTAGISGRPARGLINRLIQHVTHIDAPAPPAYPVAYDLAKHLANQAPHQVEAYAAHWAGTHVAHIREYPAAELMRILVNEWHHAQRQADKGPSSLGNA
ncbi:MAG: NAD(P)H-dependent flavin oxidoreductase [Bacteroidota bacterium]